MNNELQYSKNGLHLTEGFEGYVLTGYQKVVGGKLDVPTAGYGHTGPDVQVGKVYTQEQAESWLLQDIQVAANAVKRLVTVPLNQNEFDALTDFVFNAGQGHFAESTMLKHLNAGHPQLAALEFEKWSKVGGKVVAGLLRRRVAEEELFKEGLNG